MRPLIVIAAALLAACPAPAGPRAPSSELSPGLARYAWLLGDWQLDRDGPATSTEHWVAAGGAIYGIALTGGDFFEVMIVDDADGPGPAGDRTYLWAMPGGAKSVRFASERLAPDVLGVVNPEHDFPKSIVYRVAGAGLTAELEGVEDGKVMRQVFRFSRTTGAPARELEAADVAFAKEVAARGIEGWVAAFEDKGGMMREGVRVEGAEAIRARMADALAKGTLAWTPIASRVRGGVGFTVGVATYTAATPADSWRGSYVTIWRRQADGAWKVRFDTGRIRRTPRRPGRATDPRRDRGPEVVAALLRPPGRRAVIGAAVRELCVRGRRDAVRLTTPC